MDGQGSNKHILLMAFGLPTLTTAIVISSMYAGHVLTTRSDRPTQVLVTAAPPNIDVNVPQAAPPNVEVSSAAPQVNVHVPSQPAPTVNVHTPPAAAPNITVNPPAAQVTVIDRREEAPKAVIERNQPAPAVAIAAKPAENDSAKKASDAPAAAQPSAVHAAPATASAPAAMPPPVESKPAPPAESPKKESAPARPLEESSKTTEQATPAGPATSQRDIPSFISVEQNSFSGDNEAQAVLVSAASAATVTATAREKELTLDILYECATCYIEQYCVKNGLDTQAESRKWSQRWTNSVEQAISDNIDSSEQSYINRIAIAKRDYFNIEKATPEKIVEACRILLRYRDGRLAWLEAMKEALTEDNLRKTVTFLSAGPK